MVMVRNGNGTKWLWYEMAMVRNGYGTKMIFTMVILILHHIQINVIPKYMLHVGTVKSMYLRWEKKYIHVYTYY
jgi:hypothetical protein